MILINCSHLFQHIEPSLRPNDPRHLSNDDPNELFKMLMDSDNMSSPPPPDLDFPTGNVFDLNCSGASLNRLNSFSSSQTNFSAHHPYNHSLSQAQQYKIHPSISLDNELKQNDIPVLQQQPLALGLYVSNIGSLNPLPDWMFHRYPEHQQERSRKLSSSFKATLHINIPNAQHSDDVLLAQNNEQKQTHPLDSNYTYVVLR